MHLWKSSQQLPLTLDECWEFFTCPGNLKILTPKHLGFEQTTEDEKAKIYPGQLITHRIKPVLNIPIEWVTEITHVEKPHYFIDEQRFGPYKFWHHEHRFIRKDKGVEVVDIIHYKIPLGPLGELLHRFKIQRDLQEIFNYRRTKLEELFGSNAENVKNESSDTYFS